MASKKTTIQDIANLVGVSKSTVSRALKNHPDITEQTKRIIRDAVALHGYQPNVFAQNFKMKRTNIIGLVVPDIERSYYASIVSGVQERATQHNFYIVTIQSKDSFISEIASLHTLAGLGVDAIILCHSKETSHFNEIKKINKKGTHVLAIDREPEDMNVHFISNDHFIEGFLIGEHLAEQGYKDVAIIGGPLNLKMSRERIEGCIAGLKVGNVEVEKENIYHCNFQRERELAVVSELLDKNNKPDAIYCVYDRGATEILQFISRRNIKVPAEIGVAGTGNDPISAYVTPGLSTVEQNPRKIGELAAEVLINEIITGGSTDCIRHILRPHLIRRASTNRKNNY